MIERLRLFNQLFPSRERTVDPNGMPELTLDRFEKASEFSSPLGQLGRLPHAGVVIPQGFEANQRNCWATQVDGELVIVSTEHEQVERYQKKTMPTEGWRSLLNREEEILLACRGEQQLAIDPRGKTRPAAYPEPRKSDQEIRDQVLAGVKLIEEAYESPSKLVKRLAFELPFHSPQEAREILYAAPAVPGPMGTATLAAAMVEKIIEKEDRTCERWDKIAEVAADVMTAELETEEGLIPRMLRHALEHESNTCLVVEGAAKMLSLGANPEVNPDLIEETVINSGGRGMAPVLYREALENSRSENSNFTPYQRLYLEQLQGTPDDKINWALNYFNYDPDANGYTAAAVRLACHRDPEDLPALLAPLKSMPGPEAAFFAALGEQEFDENGPVGAALGRVTVARGATKMYWGEECDRRVLWMAARGMTEAEPAYQEPAVAAVRQAFGENPGFEVETWLKTMDQIPSGPHKGPAAEALSLLLTLQEGADETAFSPDGAIAYAGEKISSEGLGLMAVAVAPHLMRLPGDHSFLEVIRCLGASELPSEVVGQALKGACHLVSAPEGPERGPLAVAGALSKVEMEHRPKVLEVMLAGLNKEAREAVNRNFQIATMVNPEQELERILAEHRGEIPSLDFAENELQVGHFSLPVG